ncbi:MAG: hypothetical protein JXR03_05710 [Cyclobacteriaceae bacterium]
MKKILVIAFTLVISLDVSVAGTGDEKNDSKKNGSSLLAIQRATYSTAIGVRGIGTSGLTIKHFTKSTTAIEGIVGFWPDAFSATLLLEKHVQAFEEVGLHWFYGFGGHLAAKSNVGGERFAYRERNGDFGLGVDGIFGIEYKISDIPIAISLDVKPFIEVESSGNVFFAFDPGLGIKVVF